MCEENPTTENATDSSEHIYLEVLHIASRPASKKSLCSSATDESTIEKATPKPKEKSQNPSDVSSCVLIATIILLSAICCALGALFVIERRHSTMLANENSGKVKTTPSTNCSTIVAPTDGSLDCAVMESELEKRQTVYKNQCSMNRAGEVNSEDGQDHNTTPITCTTESIQFQSSSDTVRSRGGVTMASATVCFWCKSSPGVVHYVAYIEPNNGAGFEIVEEKSSTAGLLDINWHSFCWTWSTGEEQYRFYKDGQLLRGREINREKRMTGGGTWVLGLRSDTPGGQSSVSETKRHGEITAVNVWNKVLRRRELGEMMDSCASTHKGNVKSWEDFKSGVKRNVKLVKSTCCNT